MKHLEQLSLKIRNVPWGLVEVNEKLRLFEARLGDWSAVRCAFYRNVACPHALPLSEELLFQQFRAGALSPVAHG